MAHWTEYAIHTLIVHKTSIVEKSELLNLSNKDIFSDGPSYGLKSSSVLLTDDNCEASLGQCVSNRFFMKVFAQFSYKHIFNPIWGFRCTYILS